MYIRDYLETLPEKKTGATLSWVKDLPDFGTGVDHFVVGFVVGKEKYVDTVIVKEGSEKPSWGDSVCLEANGGSHPFVSVCKDCTDGTCGQADAQ